MIKMIVATSKNNCIGIGNKMPWHCPQDLAYFREKTWGKSIVMGRKTFESIGKALPGRRNIVLTRDTDYRADGVEIFYNREDLLNHIGDEELFVIGGGEIYQLFKPLAGELYITLVDMQQDGNTYFIEYTEEFEEISKTKVNNGYDLYFTVWKRKVRK